jgi:hypothetical protein
VSNFTGGGEFSTTPTDKIVHNPSFLIIKIQEFPKSPRIPRRKMHINNLKKFSLRSLEFKTRFDTLFSNHKVHSVFLHTTTPPNNIKDAERTKTSVFGIEMEATSYFKFPLVDLKALSKPAGRRKPLIGLLRGIITGLTFYPFQVKIFSERPIIAILISQRKNEKLSYQLQLMATSVNQFPHLVEIFADELELFGKKKFNQDVLDPKVSFEAHSLNVFLTNVRQRINYRYNDIMENIGKHECFSRRLKMMIL